MKGWTRRSFLRMTGLLTGAVVVGPQVKWLGPFARAIDPPPTGTVRMFVNTPPTFDGTFRVLLNGRPIAAVMLLAGAHSEE